MNEEAQIKLREILAKDINDLSQSDKEFMWARRDYIGKNSRAKFASVFDELAKPKPEVKKQEAPVNQEENEKKTEAKTDEQTSETPASPFENEVVDLKDDVVEPKENTEDEDDDIVE